MRARDYRGKSFRFHNKLGPEKEKRKGSSKREGEEREERGCDLFGETVDWLPIVNE